jgi:hypothetical protein
MRQGFRGWIPGQARNDRGGMEKVRKGAGMTGAGSVHRNDDDRVLTGVLTAGGDLGDIYDHR